MQLNDLNELIFPMLAGEPPPAKGPPNCHPSLKRCYEKNAKKCPGKRGRENLKKKWKKEKGSFFMNPPSEKFVWWQALL